ncbi:uncharacterized protein LOC131226829 [Magnolia sinica]|uniref:uncharacterized protein LOC131226829 n=1 Tax=Magnolia sinica TaxID=86752 RepID=UPI002657DE8A|nr:uncharacterized protein LOC131226829 [Magnolia sinica]
MLAKIGLYNAIEVTSQYFYKEPTVMKGFLEYWSPTTNSFHLPFGLPLTGKFYDEFVLSNRELAFVSSPDRKPSISETTIELFREMEKFPNIHKLSFAVASTFHEGPQLTEFRDNIKEKADYSLFEELAGFLAYWLSIVVLQSLKWVNAIRPTVFVVADALTEGHKYSLAPPVLCFIYRALGDVATHVKNLTIGASSAHTSWHYFTGWLGVYFPWTFEAPEKAYVHPAHLPLWFFQQRVMAKRSYNWVANKIRDTDQVDFFQFRLHLYIEDTNMVDQAKLIVAERAFFLSIRSCSLPLREGTKFWREPYYPSRFARQFGYDQAVPEDCGLVTKRMCCYGTSPINWAMIWK